jgi:hypothetical protein
MLYEIKWEIMLVINFHKLFSRNVTAFKVSGGGECRWIENIIIPFFIILCNAHAIYFWIHFLLKIFFCANSYPGQEQKFIRYIKEAFLIQRHASEQIKNTENFELFGHKM